MGGQGFNANMSQADLDEILRQFGGGAGGRQSQSTGGFGFDDIFSTFRGQGRRVFRRIWWQTVATLDQRRRSARQLSIDLKATDEGDTRKISLSLPVQNRDRSGLSNQDH